MRKIELTAPFLAHLDRIVRKDSVEIKGEFLNLVLNIAPVIQYSQKFDNPEVTLLSHKNDIG
jgi:hypothetical protein